MPSFHHDFTFNPDGSGRVTVRWTGPGGPGAPSPDEFVRSELERAQGVVAWADVDCATDSSASGEQLVFTATAWFADVRALRFHCQGFHLNLLDFAVERHDDGAVTIRSLPPAAGDGPVAVAADANPEELRRAIADERAKIGMAREFLAGMFGDLVATAVLRAPAPLVGRTPGQRLDERTVEVQFEGQKLVAIIDRLLTDDAAMAKLLRLGAATAPRTCSTSPAKPPPRRRRCRRGPKPSAPRCLSSCRASRWRTCASSPASSCWKPTPSATCARRARTSAACS
jgi:hypothetical protein